MDGRYNAPDTQHSPVDTDAEQQYQKGTALTTTVVSFVNDFQVRHPEAVVWDAWYQSTWYFFIQKPAASQRNAEELLRSF